MAETLSEKSFEARRDHVASLYLHTDQLIRRR